MKITTRSLREIVKKIVDRKLNENENFMALRRLTVMARDFSLNFEDKIVTELGLMDPNKMDQASQARYFEAMKTMENKIIAATVDAVREVENLPKPPEQMKG